MFIYGVVVIKSKKIIGDIFLNALSSILPVILLQLLILPVLGRQMSDDQYGLMLTFVSIITVFSATFGNSLNNIRLLVDLDYTEQGESGDFNLILLSYCILNSFCVSICALFYRSDILISSILLINIASLGGLLKEYLCVDFRLKLDYKAIVVNSLFLSIGYVVGYLLYLPTHAWVAIYIGGNGLSLLYCLGKTKLILEPFHITPLFRETCKKSLILLLSSFLASCLAYIDRLFLFPIMGGAAVSIYYSATLFGKIISMGISPITGVMLSYFSKIKALKHKTFWIIFFCSTGIGIVGYVACILLSKPILTFLYPQWADQSLQYIHITSATAIITMISSVLHPVVLRYRNTIWQIGIHVINIVVYFGSSWFLVQRYGLTGFCIGALITALCKLLLMVSIFLLGSSEQLNEI